jgi:hypothetical protein
VKLKGKSLELAAYSMVMGQWLMAGFKTIKYTEMLRVSHIVPRESLL